VLPGGAAAGESAGDSIKIVDFGIAKDTRAATPAELDAAVPLQRPLSPGPAGEASGPARGSAPRPQDSLHPHVDSGEISGGTPSANQGLTRVGASIGTPRYMAPEQVDGMGIDTRADQYALGCILYQMIGGQAPFSAPSAMELLSMHMFDKPQPLRERYPSLDVPASVDALVLRLLAKNKLERFESMKSLAAALAHEIEVLSLQRGERVAVTPGLAAQLGAGRGTHVIVRGRKLPLWGVGLGGLALLGLLSLGGVWLARFVVSDATVLPSAELQALEAKARQILLGQLHAPTADVRLGAMRGLAQAHDSAFRDPLEQLLRDGAPSVHARAAEALGQLGDRRALPALRGLLSGTSLPPVQAAAAHAIWQLGDAQGQTALEAMLESQTEEVRLRAALLLCPRGHEKALSLLAAALDGGGLPDAQRLSTLSCLTQAGKESAQQALRMQLRGPVAGDAMLAAGRLAQLGQEEGRAFLRERMRQPGSEQLLAARFLAAPDEPQVAELFRQVLADRRSGTPARQLASEGLGLCGQLHDVRLLGRQLDGSIDPLLQQSAASSILVLARNEPGALSEGSLRWARAALSDGEWTIRESAVAVLGDSAAADAVPLLSSLMNDIHPSVRQSAARALGRRKDERALQALKSGLQDREGAVRKETLLSLLRLSDVLPAQAASRQTLERQAGSWVKELISSNSEAEQSLSRALLLKLGDRSQLLSLQNLSRSASEEVRRIVIGQLGRELDLLAGMLADAVFAVRFDAARQLAQAGDRRAIPVLQEAEAHKGGEAILAAALLRKLGEPASTDLSPGQLDALARGSVTQRLGLLDGLAALPASELGQVLQVLRRLARDADSHVRQRVAEVAASLPVGPAHAAGGPAGGPILRLLATDGDAGVRARAAALLADLLRGPGVALISIFPEALPAAGRGDGDGRRASAERGLVATLPGAGSQSSPAPDMREGADGEKLNEAQGTGFVLIDAPPLVQFQIDKGRWQTANKRPISLSVGLHELTSLAGKQRIQIEEGTTLNLRLPESMIEKMMSGGLDALAKRDMKKAQKLLEKANSLCNREGKNLPPCIDLAVEIHFQLGQLHETGDRPAEAVTAYQKVLQAGTRGGGRRAEAQKAVDRLLPSVGQVVLRKPGKGRCQEVTLYMLPGKHLIDVDGDQQQVQVRANETVRLGSCE